MKQCRRKHFLKAAPPWNGTTAELPLQRGKIQEKVKVKGSSSFEKKEELLDRPTLFLHPDIF